MCVCVWVYIYDVCVVCVCVHLTSTEYEAEQLAQDEVEGRVGDGGESRRRPALQPRPLLLLRQHRLAEVGCQGEDGPGNDGHQLPGGVF